jgi:hypothetical protein
VLTHFLAGDLAADRARSTARAASVRTMDEHFDDMFALYAGKASTRAAA